MERQIFVAVRGERQGPYPESQVRQMLAAGNVMPGDLGWYQGMTDWAPLAQIVPPAAAVSLDPGIPDIPEYHPRPMPKGFATKGHQGVGGWLLFYCILLTIVSPLITFASMASNWTAALPAFDRFPSLRSGVVIENCVMALIAVSGIAVGVMLWARMTNAKKIVQGYLIGRLVLFILVEILVVAMVTSKAPEISTAIVSGVVGACVREGIYFAIWFSYFGRSVRVMNTYDS